ncbi:MAG: hypothetical protein IRZ05_03465 [Micromonosporaceae bacterium]|jgi:hypothetical protein|nr:hypothetical protein [Micromonosporaceae bacterium]
MPDQDSAWANEFTIQMTVQGAGAGDIAKALADVRAHCADSGESAYEAFGDPKTYATALAAELPAKQPGIDLRAFGVLLMTAVAFGLLLVGSVSLAESRDNEVPLTLGKLLLVVVAVPAWVVLTQTRWARRRPRDPATPDRPAFDERYWRALWLALGLAVVGAALWIGLDRTLWSVSKWLFPGLGFGLLVLSQLARWLVTRSAAEAGSTAAP